MILPMRSQYTPSDEEQLKFDTLQLHFSQTFQAMLVESRFNKWEFDIRREILANKMRDRFKLIEGGNHSSTSISDRKEA